MSICHLNADHYFTFIIIVWLHRARLSIKSGVFSVKFGL